MKHRSDSAPIPLFVIGRQRSGTTWVANTLCNHSQVFGIMIPSYYGIKESWFFSHFDGRFGSLSKRENYQDFLDLFSKTIYFKLSQVKKGNLEELDPKNYADFFSEYMEIAAEIDTSAARPYQYWLEKSPIHTLYLQELIHYYPDARFIGIERELVDVVRSTKKWIQLRDKKEKLPRSFLPRAVLHWGRCRSFLRHYCKKNGDRFILLSYEELKRDPLEQFKAVFSFLDLDWEDGLLEKKYGINTSFNHSRREDALSRPEEIATHILGIGASIIPFPLYQLEETTKRPRYNESFHSLFMDQD